MILEGKDLVRLTLYDLWLGTRVEGEALLTGLRRHRGQLYQ
jgi:hypothetical protein